MSRSVSTLRLTRRQLLAGGVFLAPGAVPPLGRARELVGPPREAVGPPQPVPRHAPPRLPGTYATLRTTAGDIVLRMLPEDAPLTVANFLGLAEGTKPFRD